MSAITIDNNDLVHYEVMGRGRPVILIHGWLGSWRYWIPTMQQLNSKFRIYALDLWGFGDTQKNVTHYDLKSQVALLGAFMEKLGITKAAIVGHGLGAAVAIEFARTHPEAAPRVMLVSPPLFELGGWAAVGVPDKRSTNTVSAVPAIGSTATIPSPASKPLDPVTTADTIRRNPFLDNPEILLKLGLTPPTLTAPNSGTAAVAAVVVPPAPPKPPTETPRTDRPNPLLTVLNGKARSLLERNMARNNESFDKLLTEIEKMDERVIDVSAKSFNGINLAVALHQVTSPTLLLHGKDDGLLTPPDEDLVGRIGTNKPDGHFLPFVVPEFRHFPMLENTVKFNRLLSDFLETPEAELANVQLKEMWRRQLR